MKINNEQLMQALSAFIDEVYMPKASTNIEKGIFATAPIFLSFQLEKQIQANQESLQSAGVLTEDMFFDVDIAEKYAKAFIDGAGSLEVEKRFLTNTFSFTFDKEDVEKIINIIRSKNNVQ